MVRSPAAGDDTTGPLAPSALVARLHLWFDRSFRPFTSLFASLDSSRRSVRRDALFLVTSRHSILFDTQFLVTLDFAFPLSMPGTVADGRHRWTRHAVPGSAAGCRLPVSGHRAPDASTTSRCRPRIWMRNTRTSARLRTLTPNAHAAGPAGAHPRVLAPANERGERGRRIRTPGGKKRRGRRPCASY